MLVQVLGDTGNFNNADTTPNRAASEAAVQQLGDMSRACALRVKARRFDAVISRPRDRGRAARCDSGERSGPMWKPILGYGALLALGTLALQWLDYQRFARAHAGDIYIFLIALAFLALGIYHRLARAASRARARRSTATRRRRRRSASARAS